MGCSQASTIDAWGSSWPTLLAIIWSTLTPEWISAPLVMVAPDSRLPVWAGWIPCPVSDFTYRPSMTLILDFSGSSGLSDLASFMSAPLPVAPQ